MLGSTMAQTGQLAEITHHLFPQSALVAVHRELLAEEEGVEASNTIYSRLSDENMELKSKLEQNDRQLLEL